MTKSTNSGSDRRLLAIKVNLAYEFAKRLEEIIGDLNFSNPSVIGLEQAMSEAEACIRHLRELHHNQVRETANYYRREARRTAKVA